MLNVINRKGLRPAGAVPLLALAALLAGVAPASAGARNAHDEAINAIIDIRAVIGEINASSNLMAHDPGPYKESARRAVNALVGTGGPGYDARAENPGDDAGVMGHLNWLVENAKAGDQWGPVVQGALVNVKVAKAQLDDALGATELEDYWTSTTGALEALLVALGRDSEVGVLGGLHGAMATTELGVPEGAVTVSGCDSPTQAPAYGVVDGYLAYVAVPREEGSGRLAAPIGVRDVRTTPDHVVLYTAAIDKAAELCPDMQKAAATGAGDAAQADADPPVGLYTEAQAKQGEQVFNGNCAPCHGKNLQGVSAPRIAGPKFLKKVHMLDWSVENLRQLVITSMPASNPGSLSPKQYSEVLSYLLAVNCYPAGKQDFPTKETTELKKTKLHQLSNVKPTDEKLGTCPLQQHAQRAEK